jgi:IS30 family transposase
MNTKYKHLNCEERTLIQLSLERGCTIRVISRSLDRSPSSVSQEFARNDWCDPKLQPARADRPIWASGYRSALVPASVLF